MNFKQIVEHPNRFECTQEMFCRAGDFFEFRLLRCVLHPRLTILHRWDIRLETTTMTFQVDGIDYPDSASAFAALFADEELFSKWHPAEDDDLK